MQPISRHLEQLKGKEHAGQPYLIMRPLHVLDGTALEDHKRQRTFAREVSHLGSMVIVRVENRINETTSVTERLRERYSDRSISVQWSLGRYR